MQLASSTATIYTFSTPVNVTSDFAACVVFPITATNDTLAVYGNPVDCHTTDSLAWTLEGDGNWYSYSNCFMNWCQNMELAILPIVCSTSGIHEYANNTVGVYPNPSNNIVNVVSNQNIESVKIINTIGQTVYENNIGQNYAQINTSEFKAGFYFVQVKNKDE